MFDDAIVAVARKRQSVAASRYYAVHYVMPSIAEQYYVAFAKRFCIAGRELYFSPFVSYERTHTMPLDAHNDILAVGNQFFDLREEYVVAQYFHRRYLESPKTVSYDSLAAAASGRHSR